MTIQIGRFNFEGPYTDTNPLKDQSGVYAILGNDAGRPPVVVDIGESATVRTRLDRHDRAPQWERRGHQSLSAAVLYANEAQRMAIEKELRAHFNPPCGDR